MLEPKYQVGEQINDRVIVAYLGRLYYGRYKKTNGRYSNTHQHKYVIRCDRGHEFEAWQSAIDKIVKSPTAKCGGCYWHNPDDHFREMKVSYLANKNKVIRDGGLFDISFDEYVELVLSNCFYCGNPPSQRATSARLNNGREYVSCFNGLDQITPRGGYTLNNVVPCCRQCNLAKNAYSFQEFIQMCKRIAERFNF